MADVSEIDNIDKTPLLKPKRTRPPPSEKQKENFKLLQQKRAESIAKKKEEKIYKSIPESRHKKVKCKFKGCNKKIRQRLIEGHYRKHRMIYLRDEKGKFSSKIQPDIVTK